MREIRFRAWDKQKNKMRDVWDVSMQHAVDGSFTISCPGKAYQDFESGEYDCDIDVLGSHAFELMQFIGLKDKNEKKIYEGDILKFVYGQLSEVIFYGARFVLDDKKRPTVFDYITSPNLYEIIGNIYENPELLTAPRASREP